VLSVLSLAIAVGLVVSLLFSELFGLAAGGMVVPGYFALYLDRPLSIALTFAVAVVCHFLVTLLANVAVIYGRRRTVITILIAYLLRMAIDAAPWTSIALADSLSSHELSVIGYIIPGLVALWIERQGLVETLAALLIAAVVVRLALIVVLGAEFHA
jgi:poly-gamma-glutamate biosynthesis protein PgsC/CapC